MSTPLSKQQVVCVIGPRRLQNELIVHHLEEQTGAKCLAAGSFDEARSRFEKAYDRVTLFLWDCEKKDLAGELTGLKHMKGILPKDSSLGLFNVESKSWKHRMTLPTQVKGVFLAEGSGDDFIRGVSCMLKGESWLPYRKTTQGPATGGVCVGNLDSPYESLTQRERFILSLIQQGKSNQQIADTLGVQYKTVKNHTNNLFRKMNVSNRFQAALLAKRQ